MKTLDDLATMFTTLMTEHQLDKKALYKILSGKEATGNLERIWLVIPEEAHLGEWERLREIPWVEIKRSEFMAPGQIAVIPVYDQRLAFAPPTIIPYTPTKLRKE